MSKIALKANDSGTGTFEIQVPATNTNRVLELPDEAGKVLTDVSDIEPQVKTATNASGAAPIYACRAWVNFDGTNGSIRGSGNVSSVTRTSTGEYTVNFSTAMPDANYSVSVTGTLNTNQGTNTPMAYQMRNEESMSTTNVRVFSRTDSSNLFNAPFYFVAIFR